MAVSYQPLSALTVSVIARSAATRQSRGGKHRPVGPGITTPQARAASTVPPALKCRIAALPATTETVKAKGVW